MNMKVGSLIHIKGKQCNELFIVTKIKKEYFADYFYTDRVIYGFDFPYRRISMKSFIAESCTTVIIE